MFKDLPSGETHCDLIADAKQRALDLYKPPFRYHLGFVWDSNGEIVCAPQLDFRELIAEALNEYYANHKEK